MGHDSSHSKIKFVSNFFGCKFDNRNPAMEKLQLKGALLFLLLFIPGATF